MSSKFKKQLDRDNDRKIRAELRAKRKDLRAQIKAAKKKVRPTLGRLREACRRSKDRTRKLAAKVREAHRAQANREIEQLRKASADSCKRKLGLTKTAVRKRISELEREIRDNEAHERLLFRAKGSRRLPARRAETNEDVARNLDAELVPVWKEMARAFPATQDRLSRTEAFLHWVHENPREVTELQSQLAEEKAQSDIDQATKIDRAIVAMLKRRRVTQHDLDTLQLSCPDVEDLGLACDDPDDVEAAYTALHEAG